jgi:hypothetical protein
VDAGRGQGAVYTYSKVHHAIQPAFAEHLPYLILIVELDTQSRVPAEHDALRVAANLATPKGNLALPDMVARSASARAWCSRTAPPASPCRSGPSMTVYPAGRRLALSGALSSHS